MEPSAPEAIALRAGQVFQPRTPISTHELFAGRRDQLTATVDAVSQIGLHVVVFGERGVGKTSLANVIRPLLHVLDRENATREERLVVKVNAHSRDSFSAVWSRAFDEIGWEEERPVVGFKRHGEMQSVSLREAFHLTDELTHDAIRRVVTRLAGAVFIFDELDRMARDGTTGFTDLIKELSDFAVPATIVLVGVAETVDQLLVDHASIGRALIQVPMPRMNGNELGDILAKAETKLGIRFADTAKARIVQMSQGLPHYTHLIGLFAVREACKRQSSDVTRTDVDSAFAQASGQAHQSIIGKFSSATHSAHRDALFEQVLLACAIAAYATSDELGYFQAAKVVGPLSRVLPDRSIGISTFSNHLTEFCETKRGPVLERTGRRRSYRYRFIDPLLPPYVVMKGVSAGFIAGDELEDMLARK